MDIWAVIPVKSLQLTKSRLTAVLTPTERAKLTQKILQYLLFLLATGSEVAHTVVVSRDETVRQMVQALGALMIGEGEKEDMNGAIHTGVRLAAMGGADRVLIMPSDLPFLEPDDIKVVCQTAVTHPYKIIICPDRHEQGTNGLLLPPQLSFQFQFGPDSFSRHLAEARRLQHPPQIVRTAGWQFDLDTAEDWHIFTATQVSN